MQNDNSKNLDLIADFDAAARLAQTDPDAFEMRRAEAIEDFFAHVPEERRHQLRCLQWRIDMVRNRCSSSAAACIELYRMMWESFAGERGLVDVLQHARRHAAGVAERSLPSARVLPFARSPSARRPRPSGS